jgi:hypothetical protein
MATALTERGTPTTYALFPNEGHSFHQLANELTVFALVEAFLAKYLGGRVEPFGEEIAKGEFTVPIGAQHIIGLDAALKKRR